MKIVYKNEKKDLSTTDVTVLYTCANATSAVVSSILVSNDSGSEDTITVTITDNASSPATFSIYKLESVGALSTKELLTRALVVKENEILKVQAATADRLHVLASFMEVS
jgi:hypothetical protein